MSLLKPVVAAVVLITALPSSSWADWPFWANDGLRRGSKEYYEAKASDPPGARQHYKAGKLWPPVPRPTGPHQTMIHKYHHSHYWPMPYVCEDRAVTNAILESQTANGWRSSTTLFDYHFDPDSGDLNNYGKQQLAWIVNHVPEEYRQVHIATSMEPHLNSERTRSVEQYLTRLPGYDPSMVVTSRIADPEGRPAVEVQAIFKAAQENMPPPILSRITTGTTETTN